MEELTKLAVHCGLDKDAASLATGGFLNVLSKSKHLEKETYDKIVTRMDAKKAVRDYQKASTWNALPNPVTMLLPRPAFAPPGPPPWVVASAFKKAIRKATRDDKDAGNTEETVNLLKKRKLEEENILKFMQVFIAYVEKEMELDVSEILCLPISEEKK